MFKYLRRFLFFALILLMIGAVRGYYYGTITLEDVTAIEGDLKIGLQHKGSGKAFELVLFYEVRQESQVL